MVTGLLRSWGYRPSEAADVSTALDSLLQSAGSGDPFELVMIADDMTGMNGEDPAKWIAADPRLKDAVLVLMARQGNQPGKQRSERPELAGCISKPILETRLRQVLERALGPKAAPEPGESPVSAAPEVIRPRQASRQPRFAARILLAEDDLTNQHVAVAILGRLGCHVDVVKNGLEAVKALRNAAYQLVFMDCSMPEMDGYEATRLIRDPSSGTQNPKIPIVALTATAMNDDRGKCLEAGMDDYVSKPVEPEQLRRMVEKWLRPQAPATEGRDSVEPSLPAADEIIFHEQDLLRRLMGNRGLAGRIVQEFVGSVPAQLISLRRHLEQGDAAGARRQAHTLKGAAANVAAVGLFATASEAERAATAGQLEDAAALLPRVEGEFERFQVALERAGWV